MDKLFHKKINFIMKFAAALHSYGATAHGLEQAMGNIVSQLDLKSQFFSTPTAIMAAFDAPHGGQHSTLTRVKPSGIDLQKMLELDALGDEIIAHEIDIDNAELKLDQIINAPAPYSGLVEALAYSLIGGTVIVFFGAGISEMIVSLLISFFVGLLAVTLYFHPQTARFFEFLAAILVSLIASAAYAFYPHFSVQLVTLASLIVFVPGLSLTISMTELATENLASGTARLMQAITVFLKLGFGVVLGTELAKLFFGDINIAYKPVDLVPYYYMWVALPLAALGFMILFRAKYRDYFWILLACLIAYFSAYFTTQYLSSDLSPFVGGFLVGVAANLYARFMKHPAAMISMPGLILLVPGSIGFRGLSMLVEKNTLLGIDTTVQMFMIAVALVAGLLFASILITPKRSL